MAEKKKTAKTEEAVAEETTAAPKPAGKAAEKPAAEKQKKAEAPKSASRRQVIFVGAGFEGLPQFTQGIEEEMLDLVAKYAPGKEALLVDPKDAARAVAEIRSGRGFFYDISVK